MRENAYHREMFNVIIVIDVFVYERERESSSIGNSFDQQTMGGRKVINPSKKSFLIFRESASALRLTNEIPKALKLNSLASHFKQKCGH